MFQLIYASRPFGFDAAILVDILVHARRRNAMLDVTGALLCRDDLYIQLLEGPQPAVQDIFDSIQRDDRHVDIRQLAGRATQKRMFPGWAMRDDPMKDWMWSRQEVADGALENSTPEDAIALFTRLAAVTPQIVDDPAASA